MKHLLSILILLGFMSVASADVKSVEENISILKSTNSCENCNLIGADFSELDLSGVNLSGSSLSGANFVGANLTGAKFVNAGLTSAKFTNAIRS